jgi:hypothetical protein
MTWTNCVVAAILSYGHDVFDVGRIKAKAPEIQAFMGLVGGQTPEQTMSQHITENLTRQAGVLERISKGKYRVVDWDRLTTMLKGRVPENFPKMT